MNSSSTDSERPSQRRVLPAYLAVLWWVLFAGVNFYWAAGGTFALGTLGEGIEAHAAAREGWFVAMVAATGVIKLVPVVLVLSLITRWGERLTVRGRVLGIAGIGLLAAGYGGVSMAQKILVLLGIVDVDGIDWAGFWGHLLIWDPFWIVGGILLLWTALSIGRATRSVPTLQQ